jgi:hypothetical protein
MLVQIRSSNGSEVSMNKQLYTWVVLVHNTVFIFTSFVGTTTTPRKELVELDPSHNKQKKKNGRSHKQEALDQGKYCKKGGLKQGNTHKQEGLNQGERQSKANNRVEPMSRWLLCLSWCMMLVSIIIMTLNFSPMSPIKGYGM